MARRALKLVSLVSGAGAIAGLYMHSNKHLDPNDFGVVRVGRAVATTAVITFDYITSLRNFPRGTEEYDYVKSQEYMDSTERLNETKLPPKFAFYSRLDDSEISNNDYKHAKEVWEEFGCKMMRDYHNLYNKSDMLQLADVFENFIGVCMENFKLDPAWYYTSLRLAWDAALKMTG
ncbi:putative aarF domain-containing protein kinase 1 [Crotalus adamanteus]|uniref:AarF domain-containing protein kinase 1 n=1 Tax=Crotalus adamanteus TaxID=8729 RepID=A0AAW1C565_CROAD